MTRRTLSHPAVRVAVGLALGLLLLVSLARIAPDLSPTSLAERLGDSDLGGIALAGLVYLFVLPVRATRWLLLLHAAGSPIAFPRTVSLVARSWAVNILLPLRAGDLLRITSREHGLTRREALGTVAAERIADLLSLAVVGSIALLLDGPGLGELRSPLLLAGAAIGIGAIGLLVIGSFMRGRIGASRISRLVEPALSTLHIGQGRTMIATVFSLSALAWFLEAGSLVIAASAVGVTALGPGDIAVAALVAAILATIPLTPAGIGLVEGGLFGLLRFGFGLDAQGAAGVIVASRATTLLPVLVAGAVGALPLLVRAVRRRGR